MFGRKKKDASPQRETDAATPLDDDLVADALDADHHDDDPAVAQPGATQAAEVGAETEAEDLLQADEAPAVSELDEADAVKLEDDGDADDEETDPADADDEEESVDEWEELQQSRDWRDDGPFDIDEVELEGDEVQRIDFGSLIITPLDNMQLQLQVDQDTQAVQAALAMKDNSGLELALFAAPRSGGLAKSVRDEMLAAVDQIGGSCECAEGPFGVEMRRIVPVTAPDGQDALHVSRTWLAEGPRWLLRGVLMGQAALPTEDGSPSPEAEAEFVEFFKNVIVRRGDIPQPPGELIPMTLPDELQPPQA